MVLVCVYVKAGERRAGVNQNEFLVIDSLSSFRSYHAKLGD